MIGTTGSYIGRNADVFHVLSIRLQGGRRNMIQHSNMKIISKTNVVRITISGFYVT